MWMLFRLVLSLGLVSFGGGNIILVGLERALVQTGQLSPHDFAAAVALGQSTPGPLAAFTTAVGLAVDGLGGAVAATAALLVVSLFTMGIMRAISPGWFRRPLVKAGLSAVPPVTVALAVFLGLHMLQTTGNPGFVGAGVIAAVVVGKLCKVPTLVLVLGAIGLGMWLA